MFKITCMISHFCVYDFIIFLIKVAYDAIEVFHSCEATTPSDCVCVCVLLVLH